MRIYRNYIVCCGCENHQTICDYDKNPCKFDEVEVPDNCIRKEQHENIVYRNIEKCLSCSHLVRFDDKGVKQDKNYYKCDLMDIFFIHVSRWPFQKAEPTCSLYADFLIEQLNNKKE